MLREEGRAFAALSRQKCAERETELLEFLRNTLTVTNLADNKPIMDAAAFYGKENAELAENMKKIRAVQ